MEGQLLKKKDLNKSGSILCLKTCNFLEIGETIIPNNCIVNTGANDKGVHCWKIQNNFSPDLVFQITLHERSS